MKCTKIFFFLLYLRSVVAEEFDNKLLRTFQNVLENESISESCQEVLDLYYENLNSTNSWALRMLDATSKIPVGLLSLNFGELGQFSQCLETKSQDDFIEAKYCLGSYPLTDISNMTVENNAALQKRAFSMRQTAISITTGQDTGNVGNGRLTSLGISWALCVPSNCTDDDVETILNDLSGLQLNNCQVEEDLSPSLTDGAIAAIVVLSIFTLLLVFSTTLDLYCKFTRKKTHILLIAFSVYSNGAKLFRISKNSSEMACINGIRCLSMLWVLIGHVYVTSLGMPVTNFIDILQWIDALRSMTILSGTLAVDTFLFLAGLLVVYSYLKAKHHGVKVNIFQFYIHRYLRLTPALAALVLVTATLLTYMGSGPVWSDINSTANTCQKYWWTTLLYVQNYVNGESYCLSQSWYLSVDMQLFVISPLILVPLWKYPKVGVGLIIAGIVAFIITPFTIAYITEIPALMYNYQSRVSALDYMRLYYMKTHTRAAPWFIGLFAGYLLAKIKFQSEYKHLTFNKITIFVVWSACLAVMLTCVYGGHSTLMGPDYNVWASSFHIALVRPAWAVCLAWVIIACESGYGGPVNWFLSFPIYQVLGRFTYSMYLVHYPLLTALNSMTKTGIYFDELSLAYSFWGITMFSFGLAVIWVLAFESPVVVLEKVLFGGGKKTNKDQENESKNGVTA